MGSAASAKSASASAAPESPGAGSWSSCCSSPASVASCSMPSDSPSSPTATPRPACIRLMAKAVEGDSIAIDAAPAMPPAPASIAPLIAPCGARESGGGAMASESASCDSSGSEATFGSVSVSRGACAANTPSCAKDAPRRTRARSMVPSTQTAARNKESLIMNSAFGTNKGSGAFVHPGELHSAGCGPGSAECHRGDKGSDLDFAHYL
mmetsp:Transcript_16565/g.36636  ORF Transcript_16565/g.36636 Transcript_16565/m.36636 type:complete len:209 (+) Transcript_16565:1459-2085(+)